MSIKVKVKKNDELLNYLLSEDLSFSRSKLKSLLKHGCIAIENEVSSQFDDPVFEGQTITIVEHNNQKDTELQILFEDADILVINKPYGLLSVATNKDEEFTAYKMASTYVKISNRQNKVFVVHRLDRDTSGVMMFAKTESAKTNYQKQWNELVKDRTYIAILEGKLVQEQGTMKSFLQENKTTHMYSTSTGQEAITRFELIKHTDNHSLVKVNIDTGRKNQIRVHMADMKHPIIGDKKYGATTNPLKRLGLHAYRLELINPKTKKTMTFIADMPPKFKKISKVTETQIKNL